MVDWLNSILESIWNFIKLVWDVLSDAFGAVLGWLLDAFLWIVLIPVRGIVWIWENAILPVIQWAIDEFHNLEFNSFVEKLDIAGWNVGGLLTALVDFNMVMTFAAGCMVWLATVAIIKFTIKLIPGVG